MNNITIKGRLTKDPENKTINSGSNVCNFTVAVNRRFDKENADFFDCIAWNKTGDFVNQYFTKGREIVLSGEMQCRKWQDKEGNNRYSWELKVDQVDFCGKADNAYSKPAETVQQTESVQADAEGFMPIGEDDTLPF